MEIQNFQTYPQILRRLIYHFLVGKSTSSFFKIVDLNCEFLENVRSFDCLLKQIKRRIQFYYGDDKHLLKFQAVED